MKDKELIATIVALQRVLANPRLEAHQESLQKGLKELEKIRRSGKLDRRKVFRATSLITRTLVEMLPDTEPPTGPDDPSADR
jgi:hypothetical protein